MLVNHESKCYVHCPVCGGYLIKSAASDSEVECRKCHSTIGVLVNDGRVTVYEKRDSDADMQGRVAAYRAHLANNARRKA